MCNPHGTCTNEFSLRISICIWSLAVKCYKKVAYYKTRTLSMTYLRHIIIFHVWRLNKNIFVLRNQLCHKAILNYSSNYTDIWHMFYYNYYYNNCYHDNDNDLLSLVIKGSYKTTKVYKKSSHKEEKLRMPRTICHQNYQIDLNHQTNLILLHLEWWAIH